MRIKKTLIIFLSVFLSIILFSCNKNIDNESFNKIPVINQIEDNSNISYLGPNGTYTEEATKYFFKNGNYIPKSNVKEAILDVINDNSKYAVIPNENTIGGVVTNYADELLNAKDVYVVGEIIIPINQTLMGINGAKLEDIKTIYSHQQGLIQSEEWRKKNLPNAKVIETSSTALAAKQVKEANDKSIAAIAAPLAAELYGLNVLAKNVSIIDTNKTKFYVLSKSRLKQENVIQTNALFKACLDADSLAKIIVKIKQLGINIVAIHDRPLGTKLGLYNYLIELQNEKGFNDEVLMELDLNLNFDFLGSFNVLNK